MPTRMPSSKQICEMVVTMLWDAPTRIKGAAKWTRFVKDSLAREFKRIAPICYAHTMTSANGEYLVDFCLADCKKLSDRPFQYKKLLLAAEFEWSSNSNARGDDFEKLADIRADRKLFIGAVNAGDWDRSEDIVQEMLDFLNQHELVPKGEEFVVVLERYRMKSEPIYGWVLTRGAAKPLKLIEKEIEP